MKTRFAPNFCIVLLLLLSCCSRQTLSEDPRISLESDEADFGTVSAADPIAFHDASLDITNLGKQDLDIEDVKLPDGFTYVMIPRNSIRAGNKGSLKITMDIRRFSGAVSETAYILSNDPAHPKIPIKLIATVEGTRAAQRPGQVDDPDISFDHKVIDLGSVSRNKMVKCTYPFQNLGKKTLVIYDVQTTCSCFVGGTSMKEVPPGGSAAIIAKFEPYKYGGKSYAKSLRVSTNDPDEPVVNLGLHASIVDEAVLEPDTVLLTNVQAGQPAYAEVKLIQEGKQELRIKKIVSSSPDVSVTSTPLEGEKKGFLLKIALSSTMPMGQFDELVTIFTNYSNASTGKGTDQDALKDYSKLILPIKGSISGAISVVPQTLNFGSVVTGTAPISRKLFVSSTTIDFEVTAVSLENPAFRASYSPVEPGKKYEVTVEYMPGKTEEHIEAELLIVTTGPTLKVPVLVSVKSPS